MELRNHSYLSPESVRCFMNTCQAFMDEGYEILPIPYGCVFCVEEYVRGYNGFLLFYGTLLRSTDRHFL